MKKYEKETGRKPMVGVMAADSNQRKMNYLKYGCNSFDNKHAISTPLAIWTEKDIWDYLNKLNVMYSEIYNMGYNATGCVFCAFGCHLESDPNRFEKLKITHPKLYTYCMEKLGMKEVLDWYPVKKEDNDELFVL